MARVCNTSDPKRGALFIPGSAAAHSIGAGGWSDYDFTDIHVLELLDAKTNSSRDGIRRNRNPKFASDCKHVFLH